MRVDKGNIEIQTPNKVSIYDRQIEEKNQLIKKN